MIYDNVHIIESRFTNNMSLCFIQRGSSLFNLKKHGCSLVPKCDDFIYEYELYERADNLGEKFRIVFTVFNKSDIQLCSHGDTEVMPVYMSVNTIDTIPMTDFEQSEMLTDIGDQFKTRAIEIANA